MKRRLRIRSKVWVESKGRLIFSDGRFRLLEAVAELGSLRRAAGRLGMSYRAAWGLLKVTEETLGVKLLDVAIGGIGGGGARLTPAAKDLVGRYQKVKNEVNRTADRAFVRAFGASFLGGRYV